MPEYTKLLGTLKSKPDSWSAQFKDWNMMSLRENIQLGHDFVLVSNASWLKLVTAFGGAPEIPIY